MQISSTSWNSLKFELIRVYDGKVQNWGRKLTRPSRPNYLRAWLLRQGEGEIRVGQRRIRFGPGEWLIPGRDLTWQDFSDDAILLSLHFHAQWPSGDFLWDIGPGAKWKAARHSELERTALALLTVRESQQNPGFPTAAASPLTTHLRLEEAFRRWIAAFGESMEFEGVPPFVPAQIDDRVSEGLRWLNQFPLNQKFREKMLGDHLGVSVIHLNRLFAREIKLSPTAFLDQRRWERAEYFLLSTFRSAKEIAYDLGFCSPSYFTTWVRSRSGKTPQELRRR